MIVGTRGRPISMIDVSDTKVFVWVTSLGCLAIIFLTDPLLKRLGFTVGQNLSRAVSVGLVGLFFYPSSYPFFVLKVAK